MKEKANKILLTLVLPCFNEAQHLESSFPRIINVLERLNSQYEVIFVDDMSQDDTRKILLKLKNRYRKHNLNIIFQPENLGRGFAVVTGILAAQGKYVGYLDIDLEVAPDYIQKTIEKLAAGYNVVCGWREYDFEFESLPRWLASNTYRLLTRFVFNHSLHDTEAGYKFFQKNSAIFLIDNTKDRHCFWDTEIMINAARSGLKIYEQKVRFVRRRDKTSTVKLVPDTIEYIKQLWRFRLRLLSKS